jgi:DNA-directed RNA polymerase omega subunit
MMEPSLNELMEKVNNRYILAVAAAKRARQVDEELAAKKRPDKKVAEAPLSGLGVSDKPNQSQKAVSQAFADIAEGRVKIIIGKPEPQKSEED